jgi:hypothetical protein
MVDSPMLVATWRAAIENNQNTAVHGRIDDKDGFYHDKEGNVVDSSAGRGQCQSFSPVVSGFNVIHLSYPHIGGAFAWIKGVEGTIQRVRGVGGF